MNVARSTGVTGAASEMVACIDLLRRGYEVFRAVAPACECDLIALSAARCWRVEVRTGTPSRLTDRVSVPLSDGDRGRFDVLAVVLGDRVAYLPEAFLREPFPWQIADSVRDRVADFTGDATRYLKPQAWVAS